MLDFFAGLRERVTSSLHLDNQETTARRVKVGDFTPIFFWFAPEQVAQSQPPSQSGLS